jgi:rhodanese-related sulfurtransferase
VLIALEEGARRNQRQLDFLRTVGLTDMKNFKGGILDWMDKVDPSQPKYRR